MTSGPIHSDTSDVWQSHSDPVAITETLEPTQGVTTVEAVPLEDVYAGTAGTQGLDFLSEPMQFNRAGLKTVGWIQLEWNQDSSNLVTAYLQYRYSTDDAWSETAEQALNEEGAAYFGITALEFKIGLKAASVANMEPNGSVLVSLQGSDRRTIRGINVDQT